MISALIIGFVGSLHCIGMCGPLTLFVMGKNKSPRVFFLYHSGRIASYVLLGIALGLLGHSIQLFKAQQVVTFALGASLLLLYGVPKLRNQLERFYYQSQFYRFIKQRLSRNLSKGNRWIMSGAANGFLPCGLTYVAAASAVAIGSLGKGILFMLFFGLGTVPALLLVAFGGAWASARFKKLIPGAVSFTAIVSGCLLIVRGLLLSSPDFNQLVQAKAAGLITVCGL
ncbi:MAG: sulfite exporter TauE/SafE family protein [Cyclobacteriaceae bacterium]